MGTKLRNTAGNFTAHYFEGQKDGQRVKILIISPSWQPVGDTYSVSGKREAHKLAKEHDAVPWNF
jgi:DNA-binding transcriptional MocR family regulator